AAVKPLLPAAYLASSPTTDHLRKLPPSTISGSGEVSGDRPRGAQQTSSSIRGSCCQRKPRHTPYHQHLPEKVTVVHGLVFSNTSHTNIAASSPNPEKNRSSMNPRAIASPVAFPSSVN